MKKTALTLVAFALAFTSCAQWGKKIKGNGNYTSIERTVGDYDEISVGGWYDVILVAGTEGTITLEGEENLLEHLITEVKNGKLVIKTENGVSLKPSNYKKGIYITVPIEEIEAVSLAGSGDIVSETTLKAKDFTTKMSGSGDISLQIDAHMISAVLSGSGDIRLEGQADELDVQISGSGDVHAYELTAQNVNARVSGSADIRVTAEESLYARVSGSGDIHYKGNPKKIDSKTSGSGDITKS
jgi:hypothetical protein